MLKRNNAFLYTIPRLWFQGVDLNLSDYNGRTPLHLAASEGRSDCVKFLVDIVGVNPNYVDR